MTRLSFCAWPISAHPSILALQSKSVKSSHCPYAKKLIGLSRYEINRAFRGSLGNRQKLKSWVFKVVSFRASFVLILQKNEKINISELNVQKGPWLSHVSHTHEILYKIIIKLDKILNICKNDNMSW